MHLYCLALAVQVASQTREERLLALAGGNAEQIDLFAHNPDTGRNFTMQVKALRAKNYFPIRVIRPEHIYVFVVLNQPGRAVQYFIAPGKRPLDEPERFAYEDPTFSGLHAKVLTEFEGAWNIFGA